MEQEECFVCRKRRGGLDIPGGAIFEDAMVYVGAARPDDNGMTYLGYVFVEPKRHAPTLADLSDAEGAARGARRCPRLRAGTRRQRAARPHPPHRPLSGRATRILGHPYRRVAGRSARRPGCGRGDVRAAPRLARGSQLGV